MDLSNDRREGYPGVRYIAGSGAVACRARSFPQSVPFPAISSPAVVRRVGAGRPEIRWRGSSARCRAATGGLPPVQTLEAAGDESAKARIDDRRPATARTIAAFCAGGWSKIGRARQTDRGYERIEERPQSLGADIRRAVR